MRRKEPKTTEKAKVSHNLTAGPRISATYLWPETLTQTLYYIENIKWMSLCMQWNIGPKLPRSSMHWALVSRRAPNADSLRRGVVTAHWVSHCLPRSLGTELVTRFVKSFGKSASGGDFLNSPSWTRGKEKYSSWTSSTLPKMAQKEAIFYRWFRNSWTCL